MMVIRKYLQHLHQQQVASDLNAVPADPGLLLLLTGLAFVYAGGSHHEVSLLVSGLLQQDKPP